MDRRGGPDDDEHVPLGLLIGQFIRNVNRFYQQLRLDPPLERAAYVVLARIVGGGPARLTGLAEGLGFDLSTVSRQVSALEQAGLVDRTPDPADRRAQVITATETGRAAFARHRRVWVGALRQVTADWTPHERREFVRLFTRLNDAFSEYEGQAGPAAAGPGTAGRSDAGQKETE